MLDGARGLKAALPLQGKVAVVTGGALGIGRALAIGLAEAGAALAGVDRPAAHARALEVEALIRASGGACGIYDLDVTDTPSIAPTFERIANELGALDILVNNAGTGIACPALELTEADWDRILALNLKATFFCAQAAARRMATAGRGHIVNIASTHALIALPDGALYIASKGGVASLTRSLALEWIGLGIHVNAGAEAAIMQLEVPLFERHF